MKRFFHPLFIFCMSAWCAPVFAEEGDLQNCAPWLEVIPNLAQRKLVATRIAHSRDGFQKHVDRVLEASLGPDRIEMVHGLGYRTNHDIDNQYGGTVTKAAVNHAIETRATLPYDVRPDRKLMENLKNEKPLETIVINTHNGPDAEGSTLKLLGTSLKDIPILSLMSEEFPHLPLPTAKFAAYYSMAGEIPYRSNANRIHLLGGAYNNCLSVTLSEVVADNLDRPERGLVTVDIHSSAIYGGPSWEKPNLHKLLVNAAQTKDLAAIEALTLETFYHSEGAFPANYFRQAIQVQAIRQRDQIVGFKVKARRKIDGKTLILNYWLE